MNEWKKTCIKDEEVVAKDLSNCFAARDWMGFQNKQWENSEDVVWPDIEMTMRDVDLGRLERGTNIDKKDGRKARLEKKYFKREQECLFVCVFSMF